MRDQAAEQKSLLNLLNQRVTALELKTTQSEDGQDVGAFGRDVAKGIPRELFDGGTSFIPSYNVTGIGTDTLQIAAGHLSVKYKTAPHGDLDEDATTCDPGDGGILYRVFTEGSGGVSGFGSWICGSFPGQSIGLQFIRQAKVTVEGGIIAAIVPLRVGDIEVFDTGCP